MSLITIRETSDNSEGTNATISFDNGPDYPITLTNPFTDEEEAHLSNYSVNCLQHPFAYQDGDEELSVNLRRYGELLFEHVFADTQVYAHYQELVSTRHDEIHIEIVGTAPFHSLRWELLKDPHHATPLALDIPIVRRKLNPQWVGSNLIPSPTINVLIVTARPFTNSTTAYRTIARTLIEHLPMPNIPVQCDILRPGTYSAFVEHLEAIQEHHGIGYYQCVHLNIPYKSLTYGELDAHDTDQREHHRYISQDRLYRNPIQPFDEQKNFFLMESDKHNTADLVDVLEIADLIVSHQIPIVVLHTNQTETRQYEQESQTCYELLETGIPMILAAGDMVSAGAAQIVFQTLYHHLTTGNTVSHAIRQIRSELAYNKRRTGFFNQTVEREDWFQIKLFQNQGRRLEMRECTPDELKAFDERHTLHTPFPTPTYTFVGRELDIIQIEKQLLTRNILLIRGVGGAGKTTLLHYLSAWWQTTALVDQVFYFGYDEQAWTTAQIIHSIAQRLFSRANYYQRVFRDLNPEAQRSMLIRRLRTQRHLLILDNLESITGQHLAIQHTLSSQEQADIRQFLTDLVPGKTLIVLSSRGREEWLISATALAPGFDTPNVYTLPGLDDEAQTHLADAILHAQDITGYYLHDHTRQGIQAILKLLHGYPLAMEVILSQLCEHTPAEMLTILQSGATPPEESAPTHTTADMPNIQVTDDETISEHLILYCVEYCRSNLSPDLREVLASLIPFTSVINQDLADTYVGYLHNQPAVAHLPWHRWREVIRDITDKGMVQQHPDFSGLLHINPLFGYFLDTCDLADDKRAAIEEAFRQLYDEFGKDITEKLQSKQVEEKKHALELIHLEYDNLLTALACALDNQTSITHPYSALFLYLKTMQDYHHALTISEMVKDRIDGYSEEKKRNRAGRELIAVLNDIAMCHFLLSNVDSARDHYQEELAYITRLECIDEREREYMSAQVYHHLGQVAQSKRQWAQAESYYLQALKHFIDLDNRYEQAGTYHQLGKVAQEQQQWVQAESCFQQALRIFIEFNDRHSQAWTLHQLGMVKQAQRQWARAEAFHQQELQILIEFRDHYEQANTYHKLGIIAQEQKQWDQARAYYQQALSIFTQFNDRDNQARIYHQLGILAQAQRKWAEAKEHYQQALRIFAELNNRYEQAGTFSQLGVLAQAQRHWTEAKDYSQQVLQIYIEFEDLYNQAITYRQLGMIAQAQRQWMQAESYYLQASKIFSTIQNRSEQAHTAIQLGVLARAQRQWEEAEIYYHQALAIFIEIGDRYEQASTYHKLCIVTQAQFVWDKAKMYAEKALLLYIDLNDRHLQANMYGQLAILARAQRQWNESRDYFTHALRLYVESGDTHSAGIILGDLAWLWRESKDASIPATLATIFKVSEDEMIERLEQRG